MIKTKQLEPKNGVLTECMDVNTPEFQEFQAIVLNNSRSQSKWQQIIIELAAIRIQMEDYVKTANKIIG